MKRYLFIIGLLCISSLCHAVTGRNPTGVNVKSTGSTSVFITFQGTSNQSSFDAFWCGELSSPIPANGVFVGTNPCVPGTIFGHLPRKLDNSRTSGVTTTNLTDIMTIPASVSRRAYQDAKAGATSSFFYVRKFTGGGSDEYVVVTCRMAGGGARVPFSLTRVVPYFITDTGKSPVQLIAVDSTAPDIEATIYYNGSGRLKGRWEIVKPGDPEPTDFDLLPESSLPSDERGLQQHYTVIDRFNLFLPPTGRLTLQGPSPSNIPTNIQGPYKVLLRIEATNDKEGNSNTGEGIVNSGGLAGFPMPVLRYFVATEQEIAETQQAVDNKSEIHLISTVHKVQVASSQRILEFSWVRVPHVKVFKLTIKDSTETEILTALTQQDKNYYQTPPWLLDNITDSIQWQVIAMDEYGNEIAETEWQEMVF